MKTQEKQLLEKAVDWRLISLLFECPADGWSRDVEDLARETTDRELRRAADFAREQATEGLYHSVFGPGGPAPAREVSYRSWVQPGYLLAELAAYYEAFSYRSAVPEPSDHLAVETGFMAYLTLKEAFALNCGDREEAAVTARAAQTFADEHLAKFAEPVARGLAASEIDYLALAGRALLARVGPDKDQNVRRILPVLSAADDSFFECGEV